MLYEVFIRLFNEAKESDNQELFVAERGYQDWMENYEMEEVIKILDIIFKIAHMDLRQMRELTGWSRTYMSQMYMIPLRTLEHWEGGDASPSDYVIGLISYAIFNNLYLEGYQNGID